MTIASSFAHELAVSNPLAAPLRPDVRESDLRTMWGEIGASMRAEQASEMRAVVDFLKAPYVKTNAPNPGTGDASECVRARAVGIDLRREADRRPMVMPGSSVDGGLSRAAAAGARQLTQPAFDDDDDDDVLADLDIDAVVLRQKAGISTGGIDRGATASDRTTVAPTRAPSYAPTPSYVPAVSPTMECQAPPLDGSGADWRCEHGNALHACPHRGAHVQKLRPILDSIVFQLEDDDVALKNSERKLLMHQRKEGETIVQVCGDGSRNIGQHTGPVPGHHVPMSGPGIVEPTHYQEPPRYQDPPRYEAPSTSNWAGPPVNDFNDLAGWDDEPLGEDVVIPMNGIGAANVSSSIVATDCEMKGGDAKDWDHTNFAWSKLIQQTLRNTFNAKSFRSLQLLAVNATMAARDCLVLMPTGGGKSLCYQLPAVVKPGVTVVISPLISLIQDQLHHLSEMGIPATVLSAAKESDNSIYDDLRSSTPELRLLYVTPEKVVRSGKLKTALQRLYERNMLNRFVLDEAHCISAWGHDFRKDYTELRGLKHLFPTTPIMCLTATATRRVQDDIVRQLNLPKCLRFFDTFNRTNLTYEVHAKLKGKQMISEIKDVIVKRGLMRNKRVQCGIIYCFSQADCEKIASELNKVDRSAGDHTRFPKRLKAVPYHAGLPEATRKKHQEMWQRDEVNIICATVAFGMGINKPNVRFVFHHSMPKSLEAYHQESGRAGRDGEHGLCILFYSWGDASKARSMLMDSARKERAQPAVLQNNLDSLNTMVSYCENMADCRRTQLMAHFDERFERSRCRGMCDSCAAINAGVKFEETDVTNFVIGIMNIVRSVPEGIGIGLLVDVLKGSAAKTVTQKQYNRLPGYGAGKGLDKSEAERIARAMVLRGYLRENTVRSEGAGPFATTVTTIHYNRPRCEAIQQGREQFKIAFSKRRTGAKKAPVISAAVTVTLGTQPDTQPEAIDDFIFDAIGPDKVAKQREDNQLREAVYTALDSWRKRMAAARQAKDGREVNLDTAFPPGLMRVLEVERPVTIEEAKALLEPENNKIDKSNERTIFKKRVNEVVPIIKQAVECFKQGIPNPYVEEDNRQEDEIEDEEFTFSERRMSQRLSQQPLAQRMSQHPLSENVSDPSPSWKKARRSDF